MPSLVGRLLAMIRFSHTIFALPFALSSAALAWRADSLRGEAFRIVDLVGILLCMMFARSAAMAFNRLADRKIDALNPRTAGRHIPAGSLSVTTVLLFMVICSVGFVASTLLFLYREPSNPWPLYLCGPVLIFIGAYSLTKRFTSLAHFWLGASLMLAPLAAWIAIRGIPNLADLITPGLLGFAVLFWVAGFDILYACQDAEFDRQAKLHSIPARIGVANALRLAAICHFVMVGCLVGLYFVCPMLGWVFVIGVSAVAGLLLHEHSLVTANDLSRVNQAFFQVNGVISVGLFALILIQFAIDW
jgi:4-hydroxybenzoate polyprenyltransferase